MDKNGTTSSEWPYNTMEYDDSCKDKDAIDSIVSGSTCSFAEMNTESRNDDDNDANDVVVDDVQNINTTTIHQLQNDNDYNNNENDDDDTDTDTDTDTKDIATATTTKVLLERLGLNNDSNISIYSKEDETWNLDFSTTNNKNPVEVNSNNNTTTTAAVSSLSSNRIFETISSIYSTPDPTWADNNHNSTVSNIVVNDEYNNMPETTEKKATTFSSTIDNSCNANNDNSSNNNNININDKEDHDDDNDDELEDDGRHTTSSYRLSSSSRKERRIQQRKQRQQEHRQQQQQQRQQAQHHYTDDMSIDSDSVYRITAAAATTLSTLTKIGLSSNIPQQHQLQEKECNLNNICTKPAVVASVGNEQQQQQQEVVKSSFNIDNKQEESNSTTVPQQLHPAIRLATELKWNNSLWSKPPPRYKRYHRGSVLLQKDDKSCSNDRYVQQQEQRQHSSLMVSPSTTNDITKVFSVLLCCGTSSLLIYAISLSFISLVLLVALTKKAELPQIEVAMIGNSMMYYNDLPRFLEGISDGNLQQDSCLHGNANFNTILTWGNGMYNIWNNGDSRIYNYHNGHINDFGACTVQQLLFGYDPTLDKRVQYFNQYNNNDDYQAFNESSSYDDAVEVTYDVYQQQQQQQQQQQGGQQQAHEKVYSDDFYSYYDGSNPCLLNQLYYNFLQNKYAYKWQVMANSPSSSSKRAWGTRYGYVNGGYKSKKPSLSSTKLWDYIVMNDNTRTPARNKSRAESLNVLNTTYVRWINETGAVPVFLATYGYWTPYRDMGGLGSIPQFTSLTHQGYVAYAKLLEDRLPAAQKPRIAPVGIAFLVVWEENYNLWKRMFHVDRIHCGPIGTYLQGLILFHTLYGVMPKYSTVVKPDMSSLFMHTRRFQPVDHHRDPFPTQQEAAYLYNLAVRVMVRNHIPSSFIQYNSDSNNDGGGSDYDPQDDLYKMDDLF